MKDSIQRKLGAILSYVSIFASTLVQLLYTPFLIKMLGQSEYGLYSLIASIIGYLTVLDLGFGNAIVVYTAKYRAQGEWDKEQKLHGMFKIIFYIIGIIAFLMGIVLYFNVNTLFGSTMNNEELVKAKIMMLILSFNLFMTFAFNIYQSIITANEKFVFQKIMSILNTILKPLMMIPLLFLGFKSITMTLVITVINCIVLLSNYFYCRKKLGIKVKYCGFDKNLFKVVLGYSFWIFLSTIVDKINWSVDQTLLGMLSGTIAVSIYSVATTFNTLFINLSTAISGVMLPKISKMIAKKIDLDELTFEMIRVGRIQFYIISMMIFGFILIGREFIIWWVGKEFIQSYYIALFLIVPLLIPLIQNLGVSIRQAMNKHKFATIVNIIVALVNICVSWFLIREYGVIGAAIGTGIGMIVSIVIINFYYHFSLKLNMIKFWKSIISIFIPSLLPVLITIIIMKLVKLVGFLSCLVYGGIFVLLYIITMYFFCFNDYEKNLVSKVISKIVRLK